MTEAPTQGQGQAAPEVPPEVPEGYVPQAQVTKIAANEKREGQQAAINKLLEQTGAESIDDVLSAYTEYQGIQEAVTTEADRANKQAEREAAKAKESDGLYVSTLREFALKDALRDAGINSGRLSLALKVADMDGLEVDRKARTVSGIEEAVASIKEASPEWFAEEARPRVNAPQTNGTGVQRPAGEASREGLGQGFLGWLTDPTPDSGGGFP